MLKLCRVLLAVLVVGGIIGYNCEREPSKEYFLKVWSLLARQFQRKTFLNIFPRVLMLKLCRMIQWSSLARRVIRYNSERGPPKEYSSKVWSQLAKQFQEKFFKYFSHTVLCLNYVG